MFKADGTPLGHGFVTIKRKVVRTFLKYRSVDSIDHLLLFRKLSMSSRGATGEIHT